MIIINIPTPLRAYTEKLSKVEVSAGNVQGALQALMTQYPRLSKHLQNDKGELEVLSNSISVMKTFAISKKNKPYSNLETSSLSFPLLLGA